MIFFTPVRLLLLAAVIPGLFLAYKIYQLDSVEKEPAGLLAACFFLGALSIIPAIILERLGMGLLDRIFPYDTIAYNILLNFVVIACVEELCKYFFLKRATWNNREFNYRFDGVVYAVFVGLGFAVFENISYVMSYGFLTALIRAVTAVPAHTIFGIFMGHYYGLAKSHSVRGDYLREKRCLWMAVILPILLHGFYDFTASADSGLLACLFWIFLIFLYIISFRRLKEDARTDRPI